MKKNKLKLSLVAFTFANLLSAPAIAEVASSSYQLSPAADAFTVMPAIRAVSVSPDGNQLAVVRATSQNGDYIIEIKNLAKPELPPVRLGADRMLVSGVNWVSNDKVLVVFRQLLKTGATKRWVNKIAITSADGKGSWLVPFKDNPRAGFTLVNILPDNPDEILVEARTDDKPFPNVVRFNVNTGRAITVLRGSDQVSGQFLADMDGEVRAGTGFNLKVNGPETYVRAKGSEEWQLLKTVSPKQRESFVIAGISKDNPNEIYVIANMGQDTTGLYLYDITKKTYSERLFGLDGLDTDAITQDRDGTLLEINYTDKWPTRYIADNKRAELIAGLEAQFPDQLISVVSRSVDGSSAVIRTMSNKNPGTYYLLSANKQLLKIGESQPMLTADKLSDVKYISYSARDGRKIYAYVTVPKGKGPFPAVVLPHGGPWVRDTVVFDEWSQMLASQGYIVIQPNYRGSTGYGLQHWTAGDKNWGLKMQDDLDDAAKFLVNAGLATDGKLAMFGWSYGGYAAFAGSMRENNIYNCTIAGAGVADLGEINATLNDNRFLARLQRPTIAGVNPMAQPEKVNVPLLVIHGDIDVRVPVQHSRDFVAKMVELKKPHKYIELKDADHFSDTLFRNHQTELYGGLLSWLANECRLPTSQNPAK